MEYLNLFAFFKFSALFFFSCELEKTETKTEERKPDLEGVVPLHVGSQVFISKRDILRILHNDCCVYTGSLSEIVFGRTALIKCYELDPSERLYGLNLNYLNSIITHVIMVFKSRNEDINADQVKSFVLNKINQLGEKHHKTDL
ncbi:uncharacterized protein LOC129943310 isoform X2 [Eupeodes corollae]|uniref:uncharacterized protein LOC129943310 isoform X2 n=1 Tax=Eupeodes corollae TaxID=290404 RepID=UPI002492D755|nr:uncharacterized protein LOC129943310 isoform X2 [Eupeodes corollae]